MIDDITVLSQRILEAEPEWVPIMVIVSFFICCIGVLIMVVGENMNSYTLFDIGGCIGGVAIIIVFAFALIGCLYKKPTGQYEYQVLIDDSANFKEIYDKYEIIDVKGEIYIIRDKEYE